MVREEVDDKGRAGFTEIARQSDGDRAGRASLPASEIFERGVEEAHEAGIGAVGGGCQRGLAAARLGEARGARIRHPDAAPAG